MAREIPEFALDTPGLMEALQDDESLKIIARLQARKSAATLQSIAKLAGLAAPVAQRRLDRLCELRLVEKIRRSRANREWRYRLAAPEFCIRVNTGDPDAWRRVNGYQTAYRERARREVEARSVKAPPVPPTFQYFALNAAQMTRRELTELRARIRRVESYVAALERRGGAGDARAGASGGASEESRLHAVTMHVVPLSAPLAPRPPVHFLALETPGDRRVADSKDLQSLSPRESEVARLLAEGMSRPQIAKALRLSVHTVETQSKQVYRKLGVRSRAQLARAIMEAT
jgi:DNA-binding CsgD family transcriptional regulator